MDSGLTGTILTPELASTVGLQYMSETVTGVGGSGDLQAAMGKVNDLRLNGGMQVGPETVAVVSFSYAGAENLDYPIGGMVGQAFLRKYDVRFDLPSHQVWWLSPRCATCALQFYQVSGARYIVWRVQCLDLCFAIAKRGIQVARKNAERLHELAR